MLPKFVRPNCPKCDMAMIVTQGFDREQDHQTFECLRCGHVEAPQPLQQSRRRTG
jgi:Zn ribbon nucleic-acid-binding protein